MWTDIKQTYRDAARFSLALPLVAAVPFAAELIQHMIEVQVGMFDSYAGAEAADSNPARTGFGFFKVLTLFLISYPLFRFLASGGDKRAALTVTPASALLFGSVVLVSVALMALSNIGGAWMSQAAGSQGMLLGAGLAAFVGMIVVDTYLAAWKVAAALGNPRLTIAGSIRMMHRHIPWSVAYYLAMLLPLMIFHYALNIAAIGAPDGPMWSILAFDSVVTAYLGILLSAAIYRLSRRAAERAGVELGLGAGGGRAVAA